MAHQIDTDAKAIGESVYGFGQNQIVAISTGRLYTGHINDSNYLEIHYSDDSGVSWTLDYTITEQNESNQFTLCRSELDDLFVCFWTGLGSTSRVMRVKKRTSAGVWSEVLAQAVTVRNATEMIGVSVTYSRNINRLYVVVAYHPASFQYYIYVDGMYSNDKGSTWSTFTNIKSVGSGSAISHSFIYGLDTSPTTGNVYCCWGSTNGSDVKPFQIFSPTLVYVSEICSRSTSRTSKGGAVAVDSSTNNYLLLYEIYGGGYYLYIVRNAVETTLGSYAVTDALKEGMFALGIDGADNVYAFYVKESDGKCYFMMRTASTGTWGSETALTTGDGLRPGCQQHSLLSSTYLHTIFFTN